MSCADAAMLLSCTDLREFAIVTDSSCWPLCDGCCRDDAPPFVPPPSFPHPLLPPSVPPPRDPPPPPLLPPSAPPALPNSVLVDVLPRSADLAGGESVNLCVANAFDTLELTCKWDTLEGVKHADALKLPGAAPGVLDERCGEETTYMCSTPSVAETMSTLLRVESAHLGVIGLVDFTFFERAFPPVISAVLPPAMDIDTAQRRWGSTAPLLITVQGYNFRPGKQQTCLLGSIAASAEFVRSDLYRCTVPQLNLSSSEQVHGVSLPVRISVDGASSGAVSPSRVQSCARRPACMTTAPFDAPAENLCCPLPEQHGEHSSPNASFAKDRVRDCCRVSPPRPLFSIYGTGLPTTSSADPPLVPLGQRFRTLVHGVSFSPARALRCTIDGMPARALFLSVDAVACEVPPLDGPPRTVAVCVLVDDQPSRPDTPQLVDKRCMANITLFNASLPPTLSDVIPQYVPSVENLLLPEPGTDAVPGNGFVLVLGSNFAPSGESLMCRFTADARTISKENASSSEAVPFNHSDVLLLHNVQRQSRPLIMDLNASRAVDSFASELQLPRLLSTETAASFVSAESVRCATPGWTLAPALSDAAILVRVSVLNRIYSAPRLIRVFRTPHILNLSARVLDFAAPPRYFEVSGTNFFFDKTIAEVADNLTFRKFPRLPAYTNGSNDGFADEPALLKTSVFTGTAATNLGCRLAPRSHSPNLILAGAIQLKARLLPDGRLRCGPLPALREARSFSVSVSTSNGTLWSRVDQQTPVLTLYNSSASQVVHRADPDFADVALGVVGAGANADTYADRAADSDSGHDVTSHAHAGWTLVHGSNFAPTSVNGSLLQCFFGETATKAVYINETAARCLVPRGGAPRTVELCVGFRASELRAEKGSTPCGATLGGRDSHDAPLLTSPGGGVGLGTHFHFYDSHSPPEVSSTYPACSSYPSPVSSVEVSGSNFAPTGGSLRCRFERVDSRYPQRLSTAPRAAFTTSATFERSDAIRCLLDANMSHLTVPTGAYRVSACTDVASFGASSALFTLYNESQRSLAALVVPAYSDGATANLVTIYGDNFAPSPNLSVRFGNLGVTSATFISFGAVRAMSPAVSAPQRAADSFSFSVPVDVSLDGDFDDEPSSDPCAHAASFTVYRPSEPATVRSVAPMLAECEQSSAFLQLPSLGSLLFPHTRRVTATATVFGANFAPLPSLSCVLHTSPPIRLAAHFECASRVRCDLPHLSASAMHDITIGDDGVAHLPLSVTNDDAAVDLSRVTIPFVGCEPHSLFVQLLPSLLLLLLCGGCAAVLCYRYRENTLRYERLEDERAENKLRAMEEVARAQETRRRAEETLAIVKAERARAGDVLFRMQKEKARSEELERDAATRAEELERERVRARNMEAELKRIGAEKLADETDVFTALSELERREKEASELAQKEASERQQLASFSASAKARLDAAIAREAEAQAMARSAREAERHAAEVLKQAEVDAASLKQIEEAAAVALRLNTWGQLSVVVSDCDLTDAKVHTAGKPLIRVRMLRPAGLPRFHSQGALERTPQRSGAKLTHQRVVDAPPSAASAEIAPTIIMPHTTGRKQGETAAIFRGTFGMFLDLTLSLRVRKGSEKGYSDRARKRIGRCEFALAFLSEWNAHEERQVGVRADIMPEAADAESDTGSDVSIATIDDAAMPAVTSMQSNTCLSPTACSDTASPGPRSSPATMQTKPVASSPIERARLASRCAPVSLSQLRGAPLPSAHLIADPRVRFFVPGDETADGADADNENVAEQSGTVSALGVLVITLTWTPDDSSGRLISYPSMPLHASGLTSPLVLPRRLRTSRDASLGASDPDVAMRI